MTTPLEMVCEQVERMGPHIASGSCKRISYDADTLFDAIRGVSELRYANHNLTLERDRALDGYTKMSNQLQRANGENGVLQDRIDELTALLNLPMVRETQLEAEVQGLRGAVDQLKASEQDDPADLREADAEIGRLRTALALARICGDIARYDLVDAHAEIERLRAASKPVSVHATDAVVTLDRDGSITIDSPYVVVNGEITVPA